MELLLEILKTLLDLELLKLRVADGRMSGCDDGLGLTAALMNFRFARLTLGTV